MEAANTVLQMIAGGGRELGWVVAAYLMWRLHQVTDRQHKHAVETAAVLAVIKTLLMARLNVVEDN